MDHQTKRHPRNMNRFWCVSLQAIFTNKYLFFSLFSCLSGGQRRSNRILSEVARRCQSHMMEPKMPSDHVHCQALDRKLHTVSVQFSSVQFSCSVVSYSLWPHGLQHVSSLSIFNSWSLLKFMSIELVMPSNHLILCCPLFLLPSIFPSIRVFSNESVLNIRWPKCWSFSFSISPSNEYPGLISIRIDRLDLLAVDGTLLLQHHSSKASILQHSALVIVQLSHPDMTPGKKHSFD